MNHDDDIGQELTERETTPPSHQPTQPPTSHPTPTTTPTTNTNPRTPTMNLDHPIDTLPHHTPDVLWQQTRYESGLYECHVERTGDHGQLIVTLLGLFHNHVLHEEPVKIDRLDIDAWRIRSVAVICKPELRSRAA